MITPLNTAVLRHRVCVDATALALDEHLSDSAEGCVPKECNSV